MSDNCLFCKIINGDIPADIVEQTDTTLAFFDINPKSLKLQSSAITDFFIREYWSLT